MNATLSAADFLQCAEALSKRCHEHMYTQRGGSTERARTGMLIVLVVEAVGTARVAVAAESAYGMAEGTELESHAKARLASRLDEAEKTLAFALKRAEQTLLA
jgi:hypothetical protein